MMKASTFFVALSMASLSSAQDLKNKRDILPGVIVSNGTGNTKQRFGIITMSTYWIPAGEDGVTETTYGIYMKLVGNEGIDNFE